MTQPVMHSKKFVIRSFGTNINQVYRFNMDTLILRMQSRMNMLFFETLCRLNVNTIPIGQNFQLKTARSIVNFAMDFIKLILYISFAYIFGALGKWSLLIKSDRQSNCLSKRNIEFPTILFIYGKKTKSDWGAFFNWCPEITLRQNVSEKQTTVGCFMLALYVRLGERFEWFCQRSLYTSMNLVCVSWPSSEHLTDFCLPTECGFKSWSWHGQKKNPEH